MSIRRKKQEKPVSGVLIAVTASLKTAPEVAESKFNSTGKKNPVLFLFDENSLLCHNKENKLIIYYSEGGIL